MDGQSVWQNLTISCLCRAQCRGAFQKEIKQGIFLKTRMCTSHALQTGCLWPQFRPGIKRAVMMAIVFTSIQIKHTIGSLSRLTVGEVSVDTSIHIPSKTEPKYPPPPPCLPIWRDLPWATVLMKITSVISKFMYLESHKGLTRLPLRERQLGSKTH